MSTPESEKVKMGVMANPSLSESIKKEEKQASPEKPAASEAATTLANARRALDEKKAEIIIPFMRWSLSGSSLYVDLPDRFTEVAFIGRGNHGIVLIAKERMSPGQTRLIAIKRVKFDFTHTRMEDGNKVETNHDIHRHLREWYILRQAQHTNVVSALGLVEPLEDFTRSFRYTYLLLPRMDRNLHDVLVAYGGRQEVLRLDCLKYILFGILSGLRYLHTRRILHRDLKPSNILCNDDCSVKITDFDLATSLDRKEVPGVSMTEYVVTRWYRAPEVLMCTRDCQTEAVDIWSFGMIMAEMLRQHYRPLFAGSNPLHMMDLIFLSFGVPSLAVLNDMKVAPKCLARYYHADGTPNGKHIPIQTLDTSWALQNGFESTLLSSEAMDLLSHLLAIHPKDRYSADQAMRHPYFESTRKIWPYQDAFGFYADSSPIDVGLAQERSSTRNEIQATLWKDTIRFYPHLTGRFEGWKEKMSNTVWKG